jgi:hypothetical protein
MISGENDNSPFREIVFSPVLGRLFSAGDLTAKEHDETSVAGV